MISATYNPDPLLSKGDYKGALKMYLARLRNHRSPEDYANVASCLYKLRRIDYALKYASHALLLSGNSCNPASLALANILSESGEESKAMKIYLRLVNTELKHYAYLGLSNVCKNRGNPKRAFKILSLAAETCPGEISIYLALGSSYVDLKDYRQAWEWFKQALRLNPNCLEAWCGTYWCACSLKELKTALSIAQRLIEIDSDNPQFYHFKGRVLFELNCGKECSEAYGRALSLCPDNPVYFLNAANPCNRVPLCGVEAHALVYSVKASCSLVDLSLTKRQIRLATGSRALMPFVYYCAYSPYNLKNVYGPYHATLEKVYYEELNNAKIQGAELLNSYSLLHSGHSCPREGLTRKKIRIGLLSRYFSAHSNTQAFEGLIHYLDRDRFELVLIHRHSTVVDNIQLSLNGLADEVVYLPESLEYSLVMLSLLSLDILFFTDLGMEPYDFMIPALRSCPIQVTGWGLPHTSGMVSIDYYLSSNLLETPKHQEEYTEHLVLLDGLPCCFMAKNLSYRKLDRDYFMLPSEKVLLGCTQNFWKIHPDFDLILEEVANRLSDVVFVFVETSIEGSNQSFLERFAKRAPQAYSQSIFLARTNTQDFLPLCDCIDILLDTPYYGAGVTAYMSMYVGSPTVCFSGNRLRDSTTAAIYRYLSIKNAPIASSIQDYIGKVVNLAQDFELRFQIKKDTVAAAHHLYDNQEYVRSFERFCMNLVDSPR